MNLPRLLNTIADVHAALRQAGFSQDDASRIVFEEATRAINRLPHRPYPSESKGNDNAESQGHVPE